MWRKQIFLYIHYPSVFQTDLPFFPVKHDHPEYIEFITINNINELYGTIKRFVFF